MHNVARGPIERLRRKSNVTLYAYIGALLTVLSWENYCQSEVMPAIFQALRILRYGHRILRAIVLSFNVTISGLPRLSFSTLFDVHRLNIASMHDAAA